MKLWVVTLIVVLMTSGLAVAGTACATPTVVPADGRVVDFDFVANSTNNFYQFDVTAGNSYSVEVRQDYDDLQAVNDLTTTAYTDSGCGTAVAGMVDTSTADPALPGNSSRFSFTAASTGTIRLKVANGNASTGRYVSVSVSDTTQYNVRWSTFSGFITQYGFKNTTGQAINATLKVTDTLGNPTVAIAAVSFVIPANSETFKIVGPNFAINVPAQHGGFAVLSHDGTPGAILSDAYFIGNNSTVIVPSRFEPVRQGH